MNNEFAEMLCTRFCHDIIGPIGAVNNGAEFLREEIPNLQSQAMDLIEKSSREAISRVQFYRQAYGAGLKNSIASLTEAKNTAVNFFVGSKIELIWDDKFTDAAGIDISYNHKKLILNLLIICSSALIRGGKITFEIDDSKTSISCTGVNVKLDADLENCLKNNGEVNIEPKLVQAIYTRDLAKSLGVNLQLSKTNESLDFTITA